MRIGVGVGMGSHIGVPGGGPALPAAVILAGAELAWNLQFGGTGPRAAPNKTMTGNAVADGLPSGWTYNGSYTVQTNSAASLPLEGWDTNGRVIAINHSNATVRDNLVRTLAANPAASNGVSISTSAAISNVTVEYNEVEGFTSDKIQVGINCHATAVLTDIFIRGNKIRHTRDDSIKGRGSNLLIARNLCQRGGWNNPPSHWDCIDVTNPGGAFTVEDNFCDVTADPLMYGRTSSLALAMCQFGGTVRRNIFGFGAETLDNAAVAALCALYSAGAEGQNGISSLNSGIAVQNNVFEFALAALWPTVRKGITTLSSSNYRLSTGAAIAETWTDTDNVPDAFAFADVTGAAASTLITSNNISFTGLTAGSQVYVLLPAGVSCSVNNGAAWIIAGATSFALPSNTTLRLRQTSSATSGGVVSILVTAGGVTSTWSVTTA